jgi:hypothetical protein
MMARIVNRDEPVESADTLVLDAGECERCGGSAYVVMDNNEWQWSLSCVYCNLRRRYSPPVQDRPSAPAGSGNGVHEFRTGRYSGRKILEVATTREGKEYLEWYAKEGKSTFMKERVREFLGIA